MINLEKSQNRCRVTFKMNNTDILGCIVEYSENDPDSNVEYHINLAINAINKLIKNNSNIRKISE